MSVETAGELKVHLTMELGKRVVKAPEFRQLSSSAREGFYRLLPLLTHPMAVVTVLRHLKSEAFEKLRPAEQERSFKMLLDEVRK